LPDDSVHPIEIGRVAVNEQVVTLGTDADIEARFEVLEVLVVGAEERLDAFFGNGDALDYLYLLMLQILNACIIPQPRPEPSFPA
jgi:hypothetical protein